LLSLQTVCLVSQVRLVVFRTTNRFQYSYPGECEQAVQYTVELNCCTDLSLYRISGLQCFIYL